MKERPILFSAPMVRAILDGRKTQTRRMVKHIPMLGDPLSWCSAAAAQEPGWVHIVGDYRRFCSYGQPGDRLWVKETWQQSIGKDDSRIPYYRATWDDAVQGKIKWRPSIFMPRWASRLTLEITGIRVERVQEISDEDALAEGIDVPANLTEAFERGEYLSHRNRYAQLWATINGPDSWAQNPWVWVIEFKRV